jgi:hypothetical protein
VDVSGNPYVAGSFASTTITFSSNTFTNTGTAGTSDLFLVKYDANGNVVWAKSEGGTDYDAAWSVTVDTSGKSYVAGYFKSPTITFGSNTLTNTGMKDIFLSKYDADGNVLWAKSAGGAGDDEALSVCVNGSGNPYVAGWFKSSTLTFGSYTLTNAGADNTSDIFLAKIGNSAGINGLNNPLNILVFPNPATDKIIVETPLKGSLSILNFGGQQLLQKEITKPTTTIDVSTLSSGIYFVRVTGLKNVRMGKFIKQ